MGQKNPVCQAGAMLKRTTGGGAARGLAAAHGDLWSGNIAGVEGKPDVFDPAVHYGHSEAEFGMSWCAGFTGAFWEGYHAVLPKAPGFDERKDLYLLYHYRNHTNLFGGGYCNTSLRIMEQRDRAQLLLV